MSKERERVESDESALYNCIAFVAGDTTRIWWPSFGSDAYWPAGVPISDNVTSFIKAFETLRYSVCADGSYVNGIEKVALYESFGRVKHAAQQVGKDLWASKLGRKEDIHHKIEAVSGGEYGEVTIYMERKIP